MDGANGPRADLADIGPAYTKLSADLHAVEEQLGILRRTLARDGYVPPSSSEDLQTITRRVAHSAQVLYDVRQKVTADQQRS
jgi:hypothetical protein